MTQRKNPDNKEEILIGRAQVFGSNNKNPEMFLCFWSFFVCGFFHTPPKMQFQTTKDGFLNVGLCLTELLSKKDLWKRRR